MTEPAPVLDNVDPAPTEPTTETPPETSAESWLDTLPPETKGFVQNKGWETPEAAIAGYQNLEKFVGVPEAELLRLPKEGADEASMNEFYRRIGRPEDADGYEVTFDEGLGNQELIDSLKASYHKAGLSKAQAETFNASLNAFMSEQAKAQAEEATETLKNETEALKTEWGNAYDTNIQMGKKAAREFGLDTEIVDQMESMVGFSGVMRFMRDVGAKLGEDSFVNSDVVNSFAVSPEQALAQYNELQLDPEFIKALTTREHPGHAGAVARKTRLMQLAYPSG